MPRPPRTTGFFSFAATFVALDAALLGLPLGLGAATSWLSASDSSDSPASLVLASESVSQSESSSTVVLASASRIMRCTLRTEKAI